MTGPAWLEKDKELPGVAEWVTDKLRPTERQAVTVEQLVGALKRAHAYVAELREALSEHRPTHYHCEDPWYSCPKSEEGCADENLPNKCNCLADKGNAEIDAVLFPGEPPKVD